MNDDFRYIAMIAECGSISQAARELHISQPGLSQRLKRVESVLGTELFDRANMPLKPTPTGKVYLRYAERALAVEDAMRRDVLSVVRHARRRLRVGVSMARANALLADPIVSFYEMQKGCTIELQEMSTFDEMHKLFIGEEIDFAVLTPISPDPNAYFMEVLCREKLQVIASAELTVPAFSQASKGSVFVNQLEGVPFVLPTCGRYFDPLISKLFDVSGAQLDIVVRDCSAELALALVKEGLGISIVPSTWIVGHTGLQTLELADVRAGNVLRYIRPIGRTPSEEELTFIGVLRKWIERSAAA